METKTPEVKWAQRTSETDEEKNFVYVTIVAQDMVNSKIDLNATSLNFTASDKNKKVKYEVNMEFYGEIDPEKSSNSHNGREYAFKLQKKELVAEEWPRLLKTTAKAHYLRYDFDKYEDPDDEDNLNMGAGGMDFSGLSGMPGMEGLGGLGADGLDDMDEDEADEDLSLGDEEDKAEAGDEEDKAEAEDLDEVKESQE